MLLHLDAGHSKIIFCAINVPENQRPAWFDELRDYMHEHVRRTFGATENDLNAILHLIDRVQKSLI